MSYSKYLTAVNGALRQYVLPDLTTDRARDALTLSMSAIGAVCAGLEQVPADVLAVDTAALPAELREQAVREQAVREQAARERAAREPAPPASSESGGAGAPAAAATVCVALSGPPDDFAFCEAARPLLEAGAHWLGTAPWATDPALHPAAVKLLDWENTLRTWTLERVKLADAGGTPEQTVKKVDDINREALQRYLRQHLSSEKLLVTEFKFLSGGRNRQTALFTVEGNRELPTELVLQRESPATITTLSGAGMQYRVLQRAFDAGMRVAQPVLLELSPQHLGAPFMITRRVPGSSPMGSMDYWGAPPKSERMARSLAAQLALMHRVPVAGLESIMARYVDGSKGQTWLGDINELEQQWRQLAHSSSMAVSASIAWLRAHVSCVDATESIVHNDALLHNVLVDGNGEITAVLDWEMAHIGHPFEDLGYVRPVVEQMTEWQNFVDAYVAAGGNRPTQEQVDFFTLRSILKLLVQIMYARAAFEGGHAQNVALAEVGAAFLPRLIERLAAQLNGIVQRAAD